MVVVGIVRMRRERWLSWYLWKNDSVATRIVNVFVQTKLQISYTLTNRSSVVDGKK